MSIIQRVPWRVQPQYPVGIDRGNPLSKNIILLTTPTNYARNAVLGVELTKDTAAPITVGLKGIAYSGDGSTFGLTTPRVQTGPYTLFALIKTANVGSSDNAILSIGDGALYSSLLRRSGASLQCYHYGSTDHGALAGGYLSANTEYAVAATWDGATVRLYGNGVEIASVAATSLRSNTSLRVGERNFALKEAWDGLIYVAGFWDRALSAQEINQLGINPWQLFAPLPRRIWAPAAAGGGGFQAAWARGSTSIVGGGIHAA